MMANEEVNVSTLKMDDLEYSLSYKEIVTKSSVVWYFSRAIPLEANSLVSSLFPWVQKTHINYIYIYTT